MADMGVEPLRRLCWDPCWDRSMLGSSEDPSRSSWLTAWVEPVLPTESIDCRRSKPSSLSGVSATLSLLELRERASETRFLGELSDRAEAAVL